MDSEVRAAKLNLRAKQVELVQNVALAIIGDPVVQMLGGTILIEYWARSRQGSWSQELAEGVIKSGLEVALVAVCTAKALAPALTSPAAGGLVGRFIK